MVPSVRTVVYSKANGISIPSLGCMTKRLHGENLMSKRTLMPAVANPERDPSLPGMFTYRPRRTRTLSRGELQKRANTVSLETLRRGRRRVAAEDRSKYLGRETGVAHVRRLDTRTILTLPMNVARRMERSGTGQIIHSARWVSELEAQCSCPL